MSAIVGVLLFYIVPIYLLFAPNQPSKRMVAGGASADSPNITTGAMSNSPNPVFGYRRNAQR